MPGAETRIRDREQIGCMKFHDCGSLFPITPEFSPTGKCQDHFVQAFQSESWSLLRSKTKSRTFRSDVTYTLTGYAKVHTWRHAFMRLASTSPISSSKHWRREWSHNVYVCISIDTVLTLDSDALTQQRKREIHWCTMSISTIAIFALFQYARFYNKHLSAVVASGNEPKITYHKWSSVNVAMCESAHTAVVAYR